MQWWTIFQSGTYLSQQLSARGPDAVELDLSQLRGLKRQNSSADRPRCYGFFEKLNL